MHKEKQQRNEIKVPEDFIMKWGVSCLALEMKVEDILFYDTKHNF